MKITVDKQKTEALIMKQFKTKQNFFKCSGISEASYYRWMNTAWPWAWFNTLCRVLNCEDDEVMI